jgi:hypothetical protein
LASLPARLNSPRHHPPARSGEHASAPPTAAARHPERIPLPKPSPVSLLRSTGPAPSRDPPGAGLISAVGKEPQPTWIVLGGVFWYFVWCKQFVQFVPGMDAPIRPFCRDFRLLRGVIVAAHFSKWIWGFSWTPMPRRLGLPVLVLHRLRVVFSGELVVDFSSGKVVAADCDVSTYSIISVFSLARISCIWKWITACLLFSMPALCSSWNGHLQTLCMLQHWHLDGWCAALESKPLNLMYWRWTCFMIVLVVHVICWCVLWSVKIVWSPNSAFVSLQSTVNPYLLNALSEIACLNHRIMLVKAPAQVLAPVLRGAMTTGPLMPFNWGKEQWAQSWKAAVSLRFAPGTNSISYWIRLFCCPLILLNLPYLCWLVWHEMKLEYEALNKKLLNLITILQVPYVSNTSPSYLVTDAVLICSTLLESMGKFPILIMQQ